MSNSLCGTTPRRIRAGLRPGGGLQQRAAAWRGAVLVDYRKHGRFATVRLRTEVTRGAGSRAAALAMVLKLVDSAQVPWRAVNAPHLVALVRAGARFECSQLVEHPEAVAA